MSKFSHLLILSLLTNFILASYLRDEDSDDERRQNKCKRHRKEILVSPEDIGAADMGINTLISFLGTTALHDDQANSAAMMEFYRRLVDMTDREIAAVVDRAFYSLNFEELKYLNRRGLLDENVTEDHLISLCRSDKEVSLDILQYLFDNEIASKICKKGLLSFLATCAVISYEKFKMFWIKFEGRSLPKGSIAHVMCLAINSRVYEVVDLIMTDFERAGELKMIDEILRISLSISVVNISSLEVLNYFMRKSVPFKKFLSPTSRIHVLYLAAQSCDQNLTEYVLNEEEIKEEQFTKSKKFPWMTAIQYDCPQVLDVYITKRVITDLISVIKGAISADKRNIIHYLKSFGYINQETLVTIVQSAIENRNINMVRQCVHNGLDVKESALDNGMNIFNYSVQSNDFNAVKLFLEECDVDINNVYEFVVDSTVQMLTSLHYVRSRGMVQLFYTHGADLNFVNMVFDSEGNVVKKWTKLHMAAMTNQIDVYLALRASGANTRIEDERGATAEDLFDGLEDLYS